MVIRAGGEQRTRLLAMTGVRQMPIGVGDEPASGLLSFRRLRLTLPDHLLTHDPRKSQTDPGEAVPPELKDRPCADGAACQLSRYR